MRTMLASGTLMLAALFTANVSSEPQAPAMQRAGAASQDQGRPSAADESYQSATTATTTNKRKIPCKTPENAPLCYWTHGRLTFYEGAVPYEIWKIGTHRLLGVFSGPSRYPALTDEDVENPEMPAILESAYKADYRRWKHSDTDLYYNPPDIFGDFYVCPLRPATKGERQPVCIESAKITFVQSRWY